LITQVKASECTDLSSQLYEYKCTTHTDTDTQTHTQTQIHRDTVTQTHRQAPVGSHAVKLVSKTAADKVEISLHWKLHTASHVKQTVTVDLLSNYDRWDFSLAGPATWNWL